MEEKLLKIFKLANYLDTKQDKVFAQITYIANMTKTVKISIKSKNDGSYIESYQCQLSNGSSLKWDNFIKIFENYINYVVNK